MAMLKASRRVKLFTVLPALLFLVLLSVLPLANLLALSFAKVTWAEGSATWTWEGLANYRALAEDALFKAGIVNTLILVVSATTLQVGLGLGLALICSRLGRSAKAYRTLFLLPILVPGIIIGAIWKLMYNTQFGVINQLLGLVGLGPFDWLGSSTLALASVIAVDVWHWTPFSFLLLLAAVEALPRDVFEAAQIDGAGSWRTFRRIVLPLLWPAIFTTFVFRAIIAFKVFDEVYLLTGGGPGTSTQVISFTIYQRFFVQDSAGYGAAMSIFVMFLVALVIGVAMTSQKARSR
ncbi:carbohydrate ABC transporter permease [Frigidibacter sp. ROC022]|uniref:carbohydrate ABC transporter permease n=1 Tax=Frigidibacter sp. ROC022 TaxID=2971796 RepID=UPI00215B1E21|nr:sugar ABC transporter permease [Frigidibacter sp. ROC022]MCR8723735.1 sugar ABC transporter permease [Frigidibacter sp. ROC022]